MFDRREEVNLSCSVLLPTLNRGSLKKSASQAKTTREPSKSFVKQLEERLLIQKQEIDRNEMVVKKLTMQFEQVKEQYIREQDRSHILQNQISQLEDRHTRLQAEYSQLRKGYSELLEKKSSSPLRSQPQMRKFVDKEKQNLTQRVSSLQESLTNLTEQLARRQQMIGQANEEKVRVADLVEQYLMEMKRRKEQNEQLMQRVQYLEKENTELTKQKNEYMLKLTQESLNDKLIRLQQENITLRDELQGSKTRFEKLEEQFKEKVTEFELKLKEKSKERHLKAKQTLLLQKRYDEVEMDFRHTKETVQRRLEQFRLKKESMSKLLSCRLCHRSIVEAVSVVPCGHSYCRTCRKGYEPECSQCGPKRKPEGLYRNVLVDQAMELFQLLHNFQGVLDKISEDKPK